MFSKTQIVTSEMIVYGKRKKRVIRSKGYSMGKENNFTEYLSPEREKGTKMLKLDDRLWIFSPATDRTIQLSGHLLRQSVMGSDLSYEDMMEERKLSEVYDAKIVQEENFNNSPVWIMELTSKVEGLAYFKRTLWIDKNKYVPLKENLYAKSGTLLKTTTFTDIRKIDSRSLATIGVLSNPDQKNIKIGKAGRSRWLGRKPHTRGVVKNPVDHPHGGGEGKSAGGRHPVSPTGQSAKGLKTRDNKRTDKFIVKRRNKRKDTKK